jgi:hypothetical protein
MSSSILLATTCTTSTCTEHSTQKKVQKRVQFNDDVEFSTLPEDEHSTDSWYNALEMRESFRADIIAFLTEYKRNQEMMEMGLDYSADDDTEEPVCARGLEMYFPGQLAFRSKLRTMYSTHILLKIKELNYFYGPEEASERLTQFATAMNESAQKKAHALAIQDALDARFIHAEDEYASRKNSISSLEFMPLIRHESTTTQTTCKARAA